MKVVIDDGDIPVAGNGERYEAILQRAFSTRQVMEYLATRHSVVPQANVFQHFVIAR